MRRHSRHSDAVLLGLFRFPRTLPAMAPVEAVVRTVQGKLAVDAASALVLGATYFYELSAMSAGAVREVTRTNSTSTGEACWLGAEFAGSAAVALLADAVVVLASTPLIIAVSCRSLGFQLEREVENRTSSHLNDMHKLVGTGMQVHLLLSLALAPLACVVGLGVLAHGACASGAWEVAKWFFLNCVLGGASMSASSAAAGLVFWFCASFIVFTFRNKSAVCGSCACASCAFLLWKCVRSCMCLPAHAIRSACRCSCAFKRGYEELGGEGEETRLHEMGEIGRESGDAQDGNGAGGEGV